MPPILIVVILIVAVAVLMMGGGDDAKEVRDRMNQFAGPEGLDDESLLKEDEERNRKKAGGANPLLAGLGKVFASVTPEGAVQALATRLEKADVLLRPNEFAAMVFLSMCIGFLFGVFYFRTSTNPRFGGLLFGVLGSIGPFVWLRLMAWRRLRLFNTQMLDTLLLLSNAIKAGYSLLQAMEMIARESPPPMSKEFARVVRETSLGVTVEDALTNMKNRVPSDDLDLMVTVVLIQRQIGGNLSEILDKISHVALKESVRDYLLNTQFRRDLFTRGAPRISAFERSERLKNVRISLVAAFTDDFEYAVTTAAGKITLKKEIYAPILEKLAAHDYAPKRIGDLADEADMSGAGFDRLVEAVTILVGAGAASPVQSESDIEIARPRCRRLNAHLIERAHIRGDINYLASPVTGEGLFVSRFEQMFLSARARGLKTPKEWAQDAWAKLKGLRQSLIKEGKVLESEEENLAELTRQATVLADRRLRLLQALQIVE